MTDTRLMLEHALLGEFLNILDSLEPHQVRPWVWGRRSAIEGLMTFPIANPPRELLLGASNPITPAAVDIIASQLYSKLVKMPADEGEVWMKDSVASVGAGIQAYSQVTDPHVAIATDVERDPNTPDMFDDTSTPAATRSRVAPIATSIIASSERAAASGGKCHTDADKEGGRGYQPDEEPDLSIELRDRKVLMKVRVNEAWKRGIRGNASIAKALDSTSASVSMTLSGLRKEGKCIAPGK